MSVHQTDRNTEQSAAAWIAVSDCLPANDKTVVVIHQDYSEMEADLGVWFQDKEEWWRFNDDKWQRTCTISHWLPLPVAPVSV